MSTPPRSPAAASVLYSSLRHRVAQRMADAHRGIDDSSLLAWLTGSVAEGLADDQSGVDLAFVWADAPPRQRLQQACADAGGTALVFAADPAPPLQAHCQVDGVTVQLHYLTHDQLQQLLDPVLLHGCPHGAPHRLADALLKAVPLFGHRPLQAWQARLADFPPALALAMAQHHAAQVTPWALLRRLPDRDALLACRLLQAQACQRLLGLLAAVNQRYWCGSPVLRLHQVAATLDQAPPGLADRIDGVLAAAPRAGLAALHALEGEVLAQVAQRFPRLDLSAHHAARAAFTPR